MGIGSDPVRVVAIDGREGWFTWETVGVPPGSYRVELTSFGLARDVKVGPTGKTDEEIIVPPPGDVMVRIVDAKTSRLLRDAMLTWEPRGARLHSHGMPIDNDGRRLFRAPVGLIQTRVTCPGFQYSIRTFEVRPGRNEFSIELRPSFGIRVHLKDGDAVVPCTSDLRIRAESLELSLPQVPPGAEDLDAYSLQSRSGDQIELMIPGRYRVSVGAVPGYAALEPREVDVREDEFADVTFELTRER
jgi:hypothetical protein